MNWLLKKVIQLVLEHWKLQLKCMDLSPGRLFVIVDRPTAKALDSEMMMYPFKNSMAGKDCVVIVLPIMSISLLSITFTKSAVPELKKMHWFVEEMFESKMHHKLPLDVTIVDRNSTPTSKPERTHRLMLHWLLFVIMLFSNCKLVLEKELNVLWMRQKRLASSVCTSPENKTDCNCEVTVLEMIEQKLVY